MSTTYHNAIFEAERTISDVCAGRSCLRACIARLRRSGVPGPCGCGAPGRRGLLWLWALAALAVAAFAFKAYANATCSWDGNGYVCSGSGPSVNIGGGGESEGIIAVVTNVVGTCTNCTAMSPMYVHNWKDECNQRLTEIEYYLHDIIFNQIPGCLSYISPYCVTYPVSGLSYGASAPSTASVTNFLSTVLDTKPYNISVQVSGYDYRTTTSVVVASRARQQCAAYDGAATAYNEVAVQAVNATNTLGAIKTEAEIVDDRVRSIRTDMLPRLLEDPCTAQWDGDPSTIVTNQTSGDWCTYQQGEAIIELLTDLYDWTHEEEMYLESITNWIATVNHTIIANLNSSYGAIPREADLGKPWQQVYLDGSATPWGYEPTNILARIELLLYGISGVGTNGLDVADTEHDQETALDDLNDAIGEIDSDFGRQHDQVTTIRDHVKAFCQAFDVDAPSIRGLAFTPRFYVRLDYGTQAWEESFESVTISDDNVSIANQIVELIRTSCIVIYYLLCAYCVFAFWRYIIKYVVICIKWAQEILTSLFAD